MKKREPHYIGAVLTRLRRAKLMTQEELAEYSSLDPNTIGEIERNRQEPLLSTLEALAIGLDMDFLDFIAEIHADK